MCGIVGITGTWRPESMAQALDLIAHRGPDDCGIWQDQQVSLGHRRLSIIDPAGGHQPFVSACGRWVIVFNGEIYNFKELAERLGQRGHKLVTRSDTEVLLHWLAEFGIDGLPALNGMFAFALWDRAESKLLLARDRLGIKPLYVSERSGQLVFASEIKAMLPFLGPVVPNRQAIYQHLTFQNILDQSTFFSGVEKLAQGSWQEWSPGGMRRGRFWDIAFDKPFTGSPTQAVGAFGQIFDAAVRRQMVSDFPVGSYLSGGIDSASVATVAAACSDHALHTFTGAFTDAPYYDERSGARAVAHRIGAHLHEIEISPDHFVRHFADVVWHLDEPTLGSGALPQYMVSGLAAQHVKVVLTGHGGDEMFAGYQVNKAALIRKLLGGPFWKLPGLLAGLRKDELTRVAYFLLFPLLQPEVGHGLFVMTPKRARAKILHADFLADLRGFEPLEVVDGLLAGRGLDPAQALTFLYLRTYLPTLLIQEDKVGMAHSIEARLPICDNELLDLALALPLESKMTGGALKAIPKLAMRPRLPDILYELPKRGFPTPFARWFRKGPVREMMQDLLLSKRALGRGIVRAETVAATLAANDASMTDNLADYARANRLYSWALIEQWHRLFVDGDPLSGGFGKQKPMTTRLETGAESPA
ncbi:MAG: asparagine synthase (glutamine-hydrolyzing) [Alphaproteobacteria bacterium]|nr:asparagine synthase (glutamine-hydrolyzing) [Alphaproteobacteria bacterium]